MSGVKLTSDNTAHHCWQYSLKIIELFPKKPNDILIKSDVGFCTLHYIIRVITLPEVELRQCQ